MNDKKKVTQKILKEITEKRELSKSFDEIIENFDDKLKQFNPTKNFINIEKYFGENIGQVSSTKLLLENKIIKDEWLIRYSSKKDFKGLYIFLYKQNPFYVGISKSVISRIRNHLKGKSHHTSSLAYRIGILKYKFETGMNFEGKRKDFDFSSRVEPIKELLMKQNIAFIPIENDDELALFEIFCSMKFKTKLNTFKTH